MAETQFEDDLRAMFEQAPPAPDAAAFAQRVDAKLVRRGRQRAILVLVLGVLGVMITWLSFGLSLSDVSVGLPTLQSVMGGVQSISGPDNIGLWAAGVLVLALGLVVYYQTAAAEA
jgi:hypothetical protein